MTDPQPAAVVATAAGPHPAAPGAGPWVVVPTYNEIENIDSITAAILAALPAATLLVVDDGSPDGTGRRADELAAAEPRIRVRHRTAKQGLGKAYLDGFRVALDGGATAVIQMDADWSHDPGVLPTLVAPVDGDEADLVIGSRYTRRRRRGRLGHRPAGREPRRQPVRPDRPRPGPHDLTGGFKAWRASTLAAIPFDGVHAGGYVFQIEMTYRASLAHARIREVPITFRDRRVGQSKMSRRIIVEALVVVCQLRLDAIVRRIRGRSAGR